MIAQKLKMFNALSILAYQKTETFNVFLDNCQANSDCDKNEECVEYVCQYAPTNVGRSIDRGCNISCAIIHSFTEIHSDLKKLILIDL